MASLLATLYRLCLWTCLVCCGRSLDSRDAQHFDSNLHLFSPSGRLYQLEYSLLAVERFGLPVVALSGNGSAVLIAVRQTRNSAHGIVDTRRERGPIVSVASSMVACPSGVASDAVALTRKLIQTSTILNQEALMEPTAVDILNKIALDAQGDSQSGLQRLLAANMVMMEAQEGRGSVYRMDTLGQIFRCHATVEGKNAPRIRGLLEKRMMYNQEHGVSWHAPEAADFIKAKLGEVQETEADCIMLAAVGLKGLKDSAVELPLDGFDVAYVSRGRSKISMMNEKLRVCALECADCITADEEEQVG